MQLKRTLCLCASIIATLIAVTTLPVHSSAEDASPTENAPFAIPSPSPSPTPNPVPTLAYKGFSAGYCTYYAAQKFDAVSPAPHINWRGSAGQWLANAASEKAGWKTSTVSRDAVVGAIAVWQSGRSGHVAVVDEVLENGIRISEMNWAPTTKGKGCYGPDETDEQLQSRLSHFITDNHGTVSQTFLPWDKFKRGRQNFVGYILPVRQESAPPASSSPSTEVSETSLPAS